MGFKRWLRPTVAGLILCLVAAAAYFQGLGVVNLIVGALAPAVGFGAQPEPVFAPNAAPSAPLPADHAQSASPGGASPGDADEGAGDPVDLDHYASAPPCEGVQALIIVPAADPSASVASLQVAASQVTKVVHPGDVIDEKTVQIIEWNRVVLSSGSSLCQVQMFQASETADVATDPPKAADPPRPLPIEIASKIQKVSDREFNIDRRIIEKLLESQGELRKTVLVPEEDEDKVRGIRIFGVEADSLLGTLGLENGDSIRRINGFEIAGPESAIEAYSRLRTSDHLSIIVHRGDGTITLDYNIR